MTFNRREFGKSLGAAVGASVLLPELATTAAAAAAPRLHPAASPIKLDSNENPYGPSPAAVAAITGCESIACRYPGANDRALVERLASYYQLPASQILLGCGSTEILCIADRAFLGEGKSAIAAEPTFETVLSLAHAMQANPIKVAVRADQRDDLAAMRAAVTASTGLVYVCNPNNPTGTIVSLQELKGFLDAVPSSVPVLVDEAYYDFVTDSSYGTVVPWIERYPNLIVARTFSKVYGMAGLRLGYALGSRQIIARLRAHKLPINANAAALAAALASFGDAAHVADQRRKMIVTRDWLVGELKHDHRAYVPSHANFMMVQMGTDVAPIIRAFRERGILVGRKFPSLPTWMRITIGKPQEMQAYMTALRAIVPAASA
ncbi:MAG: pyridoxal phosphate-dependent aminotransferase [Terriglobales bacterium]